MEATTICDCCRLMPRTSLLINRFDITRGLPGNDTCQAVVEDMAGHRRVCNAPRQETSLYVTRSEDPKMFCLGHYKRARAHKMCICGKFPMSAQQKDITECEFGRIFHTFCTTMDAQHYPHKNCKGQPSASGPKSLHVVEGKDHCLISKPSPP
jgi:hypothetical protein